ncbi:MAG: DUF2188 domain-containing protein [Rhodobiaceae bacterium]|jgi:hypothetical protein|nr:DUF2188 domain-containing protein [Rhodobiaceae bacterium]
MTDDYIVGPSAGGKWQTKRGGAKKASAAYDTQAEAISRARELAKNSSGEVIVQGKNGQIREKNSYGKDPYPPKG